MKRVIYFLFICSAAFVPRPAGATTVQTLVRHAHGNAHACRVAPHWGPKQIHCAAIVVNLDRPWLGRESWLISGCETGGTYDEHATDTPPYLGLGQFHPKTWARLPRRISRHSPFNPVYAYRGMRYLRLKDGNWHQWPYCSRHAL